MQKITTKGYLLLLALAICWGPSYMFIKFSLEGFHPIALAFYRVFIATIILFFVCKMKSFKILSFLPKYKSFLFMGISMNALPFVFINYGELSVATGLTAIILGMTPIFTSIISHIILHTEKLNRSTIIGILVAVVGLLIIYLPTFYDQTLSNETGMFFVLLGAMGYASGTSFARKNLGNVPPTICAFYQMLCASISLLPFVLFLETPFSSAVYGLPLITATCLGILGTSVAFLAFYESVRTSGATFTSLNSLITPVFSILLGIIVLGETLTIQTLYGTALIFLGVYGINPYFSKKKI